MNRHSDQRKRHVTAVKFPTLPEEFRADNHDWEKDLVLRMLERRGAMDLAVMLELVEPPAVEPDQPGRTPMRGMTGQRLREHCSRGHRYTTETTGYKAGGKRYCKECARMTLRRWRERQEAA